MPPYMAQSPGYTLEEPPASSSNNSSNGVHPHGSPSQQPISPPRTCQGEDPRTSSRIRDPSRHQNPRPPHSSSSQESRSPYTPVYTGQSSTPSNPRTYQRSSAYPTDHPLRKEHGDDTILIRGGSCAVDPLGTVLVEPDFTQETIRYTEFDLSDLALGKMDLDVIGHYSRPDVFQLSVNEKPQSTVIHK
uniref:CNH domain-containing protein n=2 Tax=Caenorhabditis tropicalis TaxID=1561998 RepID=A0A1I7TFT2_9PELO